MGTRSLNGIKATVKLSGSVVNTLTDSSAGSVAHNSLDYAPTITSGVSANQANRAWQSKNRSLGSGANEVIDLYDFAGIDIGAGAGLDGLGQSLALEEIVAIAIVNENAAGTAGIVEVEPDSSNGWNPIGTHTAATGGGLRAQGCLFKCQPDESGFDVTDASSHRIKITANSAACTYSIYILARHDDNESSSSSSSSSSSVSSSSSST